MQNTRPLLLANTDFPALQRNGVDILQVNLGYLCNLSCVHCHVNAGPSRTEQMDSETAQLLIDVMQHLDIKVLDLTGGAPELNDNFKQLVTAARSLGVEVIDRCNLTVLFEDGQENLVEFLALHEVNITASLPCYSESNVAQQRGKGVYEQSIRALQWLNAIGYGSDPRLKLNLVYNPVGASLPPPQAALEQDYKRELQQQHGIVFNQLYTITNMPISRFGAVLLANNQYQDYLQLLRDNYMQANLDTVMCRSLVSVDWQGYLYDCDFNQMLDMPLSDQRIASTRAHLRDLMNHDISEAPIAVADHCYGCTAGQGSSCGGAL